MELLSAIVQEFYLVFAVGAVILFLHSTKFTMERYTRSRLYSARDDLYRIALKNRALFDTKGYRLVEKIVNLNASVYGPEVSLFERASVGRGWEEWLNVSTEERSKDLIASNYFDGVSEEVAIRVIGCANRSVRRFREGIALSMPIVWPFEVIAATLSVLIHIFWLPIGFVIKAANLISEEADPVRRRVFYWQMGAITTALVFLVTSLSSMSGRATSSLRHSQGSTPTQSAEKLVSDGYGITNCHITWHAGEKKVVRRAY